MFKDVGGSMRVFVVYIDSKHGQELVAVFESMTDAKECKLIQLQEFVDSTSKSEDYLVEQADRYGYYVNIEPVDFFPKKGF